MIINKTGIKKKTKANIKVKVEVSKLYRTQNTSCTSPPPYVHIYNISSTLDLDLIHFDAFDNSDLVANVF